jgi:hypothetical protein
MKTKPIWERLNVDQLLTQFVAWLPSLFSAFLILAAFWVIHRITRRAIMRILAGARLDPALARMRQEAH